MQITVNNIPYKASLGTIGFDFPNIWGMNQIETIKNQNPYREPQGNLSVNGIDFHVYVDEEQVTFTLRFAAECLDEDLIIDAIKKVENSYKSAGWELLERYTY